MAAGRLEELFRFGRSVVEPPAVLKRDQPVVDSMDEELGTCDPRNLAERVVAIGQDEPHRKQRVVQSTDVEQIREGRLRFTRLLSRGATRPVA